MPIGLAWGFQHGGECGAYGLAGEQRQALQGDGVKGVSPAQWQMVTWRAVFGSSDANFAWNEFTVANGNSDAPKNLNRKVGARGDEGEWQTWTVDVAITLS